MITTIYLDMDDVLTDFSNTYHKVIGIDPKTIRPDEWEENWKRWIDGKHFETQPMLPGANMLLGYIAGLGVKTEILSSTGGPDYFDEIVAQKRKWLERWGITYHPNFCPGKKFKTEFATPHRLLIDDQKGIIQKFCDAGGYGVCHEGNTVDAMNNTIERIHILVNLLGYQKYVAPKA
jgi:hypothetical protein